MRYEFWIGLVEQLVEFVFDISLRILNWGMTMVRGSSDSNDSPSERE